MSFAKAQTLFLLERSETVIIQILWSYLPVAGQVMSVIIRVRIQSSSIRRLCAVAHAEAIVLYPLLQPCLTMECS